MSKREIYLIVFLQAVIVIEGANILALFPCPSISHQVVFRPLTLELIKRGHRVTVVTADPIYPKGSAPVNLTEIDVHDVSYGVIKKHFVEAVTGNEADLINQMKITRHLLITIFEEQSEIKEVKELFNKKTEKFDLILIEAFYLIALGITHVYKAPTILVSSFGLFAGSPEIVGAPTHPILYQNIFRQKLNNLSLWDKISEVYNQLQIKYILTYNDDQENEALQRTFGPDIPPLSVLRNNVDMMFLNINPIWEGSYPVPPSVIYMGGLHIQPPKELPKDIQQYLDDSKQGVIYFSFGTNVQPSLLPREKTEIFLKVFSQLPYNVIMKWDNDNFPMKSKNIKVFKWLPQSDLLRHPNIKIFITQGGLQSTDEAIAAGVPLLGIPMLGDQWYNVEKYVYHKIGVRLDFVTLTENRFRDSIMEVIENPSYRNNILRLRTLMQDQPQTPLERAMWWMEYVLRHGGAKHLRSPAANITWAEYLELELVAVVLFGATCSVLALIKVMKLIAQILKITYFEKKLKKL